MTDDVAARLQEAYRGALEVEDAIGRAEAYYDAFPDTYVVDGREYDSIGCSFLSSSHDEAYPVVCRDGCGWETTVGDLPRDPCLYYVLPDFCPACLDRGDYSGLRVRRSNPKVAVGTGGV